MFLKGASFLATGVKLGVDLGYGVRSGNYAALRMDGLNTVLGELPFGKFGKGERSKKLIEAVMGANASINLPETCP